MVHSEELMMPAWIDMPRLFSRSWYIAESLLEVTRGARLTGIIAKETVEWSFGASNQDIYCT